MKKDELKFNSSGIQLAAPRLIGQKPSFAAGFIINTVLVLLGVFGAVWCPVSAFALPVFPFTVILYTLLFVIVLSAIFHLKRARHFILFGLVLLFAAAGYWKRAELAQGFLITANQIMAVYGKQSSYYLTSYDVAVKAAQYQQLCTLFILSVVFFMAYFLCWAIIVQRSFLLTFTATFPFLLGSLLFDIIPDFYAILLLAACWGTLIFMQLPTGEIQDFVKKHGVYRAKNAAAAAKSGTLLLPVILLCFALILTLFSPQSYQRPNVAQTLRDKITDTLNEVSLFNSNTMAGSSSHVDLSNSGAVQFTGKTMLQVKISEQYPVYLKGFTGSVYDGFNWNTFPDSDYSGMNQKLNGINVQNMSYEFSFRLGWPEAFHPNPFGIQVKNIGANKQCIYAPYNLTTTPKNISGVNFVNDSVIKSISLFGISEYSLYANNLTGQDIDSSPANVFRAAGGNVVTDGSQIKNLNVLHAYLRAQSQFDKLNSGNLKNYYMSTVSDALMSNLDANKKDFVQAEQNYRLFMYDKYTQLPSNIKAKVTTLLKQQGLNTNYGSVTDMTAAVQRYLAKTCTYTLTPGKTPEGRDFTDYFLFENHKGYCMHFATAATVMLRAMGIPARYAEGYIVTNDDYQNAVGGWADVKDNRAHAWVEVYYPGFGWQPIETTPGFSSSENRIQDINPQDYAFTENPDESVPTASLASSKTVSSKAESNVQSAQSTAPRSTASQTEKTVSPTQTSDTGTATATILSTIAVIAVLMAAAALKRRIVLAGRLKRFGLKSTNRAAIAIYDYLVRLTRFSGEINEEITQIALKARFSQHQISSEELKTMTDYAERFAQEIYASLPKAKRLIFKYFYNLI
jgi:protein-glutamine gamma-glutamyltransferase